VVVTFPVLSIVTMMRATVQGHERFAPLATLYVTEVAVKMAVGLGLVKLGLGPKGAVAGFLIGGLAAAIVGFVYVVKKLRIRPLGAVTRPHFQKAGAMFAALLGMALLLNMDTIGLKLFNPGDRAAVGTYQAGIVLANTPYYLMTAMIPILFTQIARVKALHRTAPVVGETLRLALVVLLPVEALLAAFPYVFLRLLFPAQYGAGAQTLRILAMANAAIILVAVFSTAFQASGEARVPGKVLLGVTACEIVVLSIVVPRFAGIGAATTFLAATCTSLALLAALYWRRLRGEPAHFFLTWLSRYVLAFAVGAAACFAVIRLGDYHILAVVVGGVAYAAAVVALRLISLPTLLGHTTRQVPVGAED
jgi:O-antigen/teichoic acid export membrane protein